MLSTKAKSRSVVVSQTTDRLFLPCRDFSCCGNEPDAPANPAAKRGQPPRLPFGKTRGLSFENEFFQCSTTDKTYSEICATATVNGAPLT